MPNKKGWRRETGAVRKLPSGKWQAQIRDPGTGGRWASLGTFRTKAEADAAISGAASAQAKASWVTPRKGRTTLSDWVELWLPTTGHLRPATRSSYAYLLQALILPALGGYRLDRLEQPVVARWRSDLISTGHAETTTRNAYVLLRQVMEGAVNARYISINPCKVKGAAAVPATDRAAPTIAQAQALTEAMPEQFQALVLLAGFVGLRLGEAQALRRRHVDIEARTVRVESQVTEVEGHLTEGPPKSAAGNRVVDLPEYVVPGLALHMQRFAGQGPDGLVFPSSRGGYLRRRIIYDAWWKARTVVGMPGVHIHDLRHLAGTLGTLTGATTREQMARLGHATPTAALRYQHLHEGRGKIVAEGIDRLLRGEPN